jgi:hypothetical protein
MNFPNIRIDAIYNAQYYRQRTVDVKDKLVIFQNNRIIWANKVLVFLADPVAYRIISERELLGPQWAISTGDPIHERGVLLQSLGRAMRFLSCRA